MYLYIKGIILESKSKIGNNGNLIISIEIELRLKKWYLRKWSIIKLWSQLIIQTKLLMSLIILLVFAFHNENLETTWNCNHEVAGGEISNAYFNETSNI